GRGVHVEDGVHRGVLPVAARLGADPVLAVAPQPAPRDPVAQRYQSDVGGHASVALPCSSSSSSSGITGEAWCDHILHPAAVCTNMLVVTTWPPAMNPGVSSSAVSTFSSQVTMATSPLTPMWVSVSTYWM